MFGAPASTSASIPQFSFGGTPATGATTALNFGAPAANAPPAGGLSFAKVAASAPPSGFSFGATKLTTATPATSAPTLGAAPVFNVASSAPFSTVTTAAPTPVLSFPAVSATSATTGFTLGTKPVEITASSAATSTAPIAPITATITSTTSIPSTESLIPSGNLTYAQLEDAINKWTIDLEDQGKLFANQAKQLNAWDRLLITNGEKILALNNGIERVKHEQHELDQELDFILAQQKELEDLIGPLEKELEMIKVTDLDRNNTYQIAENMDSQLKQMSEDLKEVIEQINEENKTQKMNNPITQIGKILNAHMNSLQWIDRNTTKISTQLDTLAKMGDLMHKGMQNPNN